MPLNLFDVETLTTYPVALLTFFKEIFALTALLRLTAFLTFVLPSPMLVLETLSVVVSFITLFDVTLGVVVSGFVVTLVSFSLVGATAVGFAVVVTSPLVVGSIVGVTAVVVSVPPVVGCVVVGAAVVVSFSVVGASVVGSGAPSPFFNAIFTVLPLMSASIV